MTLLSIVTPSFNQAAFLERSMRSVLEQDYPDVEYIVVDGGSTDGSLGIIQRYVHRLAWWISEPDAGQADAINKGMAHAHGEVVAWLNSDDFYLPGALSSAVKTLEQNPESVLVYGDMFAVDELGRITNELKYQPSSLEDLLCFQIIGQPAVFMRRTAFERAGGLDLSYHYLLDHHLWIKIALQGEFIHVPVVWAAARYHPAAKNRSKAAEFGREAFRIFEWAHREPALSPVLGSVAHRARASAHRVDARYLLDDNRAWPALQAWARALFIHPPTAVERMNILTSILLKLVGLDVIRQFIIQRRKARLNR